MCDPLGPGIKPCLLHWLVDSSPLSHQGSPWSVSVNGLNLVFLWPQVQRAQPSLLNSPFLACYAPDISHCSEFCAHFDSGPASIPLSLLLAQPPTGTENQVSTVMSGSQGPRGLPRKGRGSHPLGPGPFTLQRVKGWSQEAQIPRLDKLAASGVF